MAQSPRSFFSCKSDVPYWLYDSWMHVDNLTIKSHWLRHSPSYSDRRAKRTSLRRESGIACSSAPTLLTHLFRFNFTTLTPPMREETKYTQGTDTNTTLK